MFKSSKICYLVSIFFAMTLRNLITNPECAKTYTDDNSRIIGQARSSFPLGVVESVYIKTQNPVLCRQKEFVFSLKLFN